jgi:hypothetical protein
MGFNLFEIATMTAEEREFYLEWFVETRKKENDAQSAGSTPKNSSPKLGPAATT